MVDQVNSVVRHLIPADGVITWGVDLVEITPYDTVQGFKYIVVFVQHKTKFKVLVASKDKEAETLVAALFALISFVGVFDMLASDPGSDLMSRVVAQFNSYVGIAHKVSLVDRPQSSGVESTNHSLIKLIRTTCADMRFKDRWGTPRVLPWIQFVLNSITDSETGVTPFELMFGSKMGVYGNFQGVVDSPESAASLITDLDLDLALTPYMRQSPERVGSSATPSQLRAATKHIPNG
jgi:hypothetical protein